MNLDLSEAIISIFAKVKELTGKDIDLVEKKDLPGYATVKIARKNMESHIMYYRPEHSGIINHLIAHECGHILRIYGVPAEYRLIPYTNDQIKLKALSDIEPDIQKLSSIIPFENLVKIVNIWYGGIIRQLTSYPSDIWIEKWIYDDYPGLRHHQANSLKKQHNEAASGLSQQVEKMTPRKVFDASNSMNYAFFNIIASHLQDTYYLKHYGHSPYTTAGMNLITLQEGSEDTYTGDIETSNKWAQALQVSNWFSWRDFENIPDNYQDTFS